MTHLFDSRCSHCCRHQILLPQEVTAVTYGRTRHRYQYDCPDCGQFNTRWLGRKTLDQMLDAGVAHIGITPPTERRPDLGPWTDDHVAQAEALAWVHSDLIWEELDADLNGTDSGLIDWGDEQ